MHPQVIDLSLPSAVDTYVDKNYDKVWVGEKKIRRDRSQEVDRYSTVTREARGSKR